MKIAHRPQVAQPLKKVDRKIDSDEKKQIEMFIQHLLPLQININIPYFLLILLKETFILIGNNLWLYETIETLGKLTITFFFMLWANTFFVGK